jgi:hypothetical protein
MQKKPFTKFNTFMIKALKKLGIQGMLLNIIKIIYDKSIEQYYTKLRIETISEKIRKDTWMPVFSTPIQCNFEIPSKSNKTRARIKRDLNREGRSQTIPI